MKDIFRQWLFKLSKKSIEDGAILVMTWKKDALNANANDPASCKFMTKRRLGSSFLFRVISFEVFGNCFKSYLP